MRASPRLLALSVFLANLPLAVPFALAPAWGPSHLSLRSRCTGIRFIPVRSAARFSAGAQPQPVTDMGTGATGGARKIKGILFDIDGTLFDSDPVHFEVFVDLLLKEGIGPIDEDFFRKNIAGRQVPLPQNIAGSHVPPPPQLHESSLPGSDPSSGRRVMGGRGGNGWRIWVAWESLSTSLRQGQPREGKSHGQALPLSLSFTLASPRRSGSNQDLNHPGGNPGANLKSISHRCYPFRVAFTWELTKDTIAMPLG